MAIRIPAKEPDDRLSPGDRVEYGLSAPISARDGSPWAKVHANLAVRADESEDEFMERLCSFVHETYDAQADGLRG